jgi:hypothetical protein
MSQSAILKESYEAMYRVLVELGSSLKLFSVESGYITDRKDIIKNGFKSVVLLGIADISQLTKDKNGRNIIVNDISYEEPTRICFILSITAVSEQYPDLLETIGAIIRYFKDNNMISIGDYNWYGNNDGMIYIEPVIRKPDSKQNKLIDVLPSLSVEYLVEVAINSEKGTRVKRVEKQKIQSNVIDN